METIVCLADVSFQRGKKEILHNIDWEIRENEHWGILGLNGSGKTSLLNIISAYNFPSSGEVTVLGNRFGKTNLPELRRQIGFVSSSLERFSQYFQNDPVEKVIVSGKFASFGVYEEVTEADWDRVDQLLDAFRLSFLKGKSVHLVSEGEKRRVLIARALMSDPKMLILDEPCSGLDILSREQFLQALETVSQNGCHIVYVTHHIEELVKDITHVLLLKGGRIVAAGPKSDVITDELLSETFNVPVTVQWQEGRPYLSVQQTEVSSKV
ncbi:ABC superfamily ATP binding cassette transporter, membrane/binding protein [Bacillus sp. OxB-1]|uniref:ABC transporter ATP-binding protein n=1 Tax=Bacillus sp. (strain OxB-1) TaxID=98228 RepID=UPI000581C950|nr:ABC transporter ATP-binding protein [Bacillus sp. OxB-1]BAQ11812.1 ABC superfamily ATP binding cassette transporter, membrane/binding protein [Bacillus sp. OxB-1]